MLEERREDKKCSYKRSVDKPCGRPLYDGEHCIFHSKDIEGKKDEFEDQFRQEFEKQKENENQTAFNFVGFVFPDNIFFYEIEFEKYANFRYATFSGEACFLLARFSKRAEFRSATFSGNANFSLATFSGRANFRYATFSEEACFTFATFSKEADFRSTTFSGVTFFISTTFSENAHFSLATFSGKAAFHDAIFRDASKIDMVDTFYYNVRGLLELLEKNKKERRISKTKTEFLSEYVKIILGEKSTAKHPIISRQIKDDSFLMRYKEKHKATYFLWWVFADCGRSLWRWAGWSVFFALIFAIIFNCFYHSDPNSFQSVYINQACSFLTFLYYSIVTFTTLGFGDIVPKTGWLQLWVALEVIMGYVMLGGLISILANKLARRS